MSNSDWIRLIASMALTQLALIAPVVLALALSIRGGRQVPGRWIFVLVAPVFAYTVLGFVLVVVGLPMAVFSVLFVPAMVELFAARPSWLALAELVVSYWWILVPLYGGLVAPWLVLRLWRHWPGVLEAIARVRRPEEKSPA